jgi:hypothetical protein
LHIVLATQMMADTGSMSSGISGMSDNEYMDAERQIEAVPKEDREASMRGALCAFVRCRLVMCAAFARGGLFRVRWCSVILLPANCASGTLTRGRPALQGCRASCSATR